MKKIALPKWFVIILIVAFILKIPSLFMPYSYGDETIYLTLGEGIRQGVPLYSGLHDNKPPLLYLTAAIAGSLFWFKAILMVWSLFTIYLFWKLTKMLFPKNLMLQKVSVSIFALLSTIPLLEGNIANAEMFMLLPTIAAFIILFKEKQTVKGKFMAGILFAIASLYKMPALFDLPVIIAFWLIFVPKSVTGIKKAAIDVFYLTIGFAIPIAFTMIWYFFQGSINEYLSAAYFQNVGYLSSWRPESQEVNFWIKNSPLLARAGVVLIGLLIVYLKRKTLSKEFVFVNLWLLFSLFAATLSERPYPHYLLQTIPSISLLFGIFVASKTMMQIYAIIPLTLFAFVPVYFNFWHYPTLPYYSNFIRFTTGAIDKEIYLDSFGKETSRNYSLAKTITDITKPEDRIFVWGTDAKIYALSRRLPPIKYVADYHIKDFYEPAQVIDDLRKDPPTLIVILPESENFPELRRFTATKYLLYANFSGAEIWKLMSPKLESVIKSSFL